MTSRREQKAAVRADRDGSGPTLDGGEAPRFPGAAAKFALFGEVLMVGLLVALVGVVVITLPAALAAGIRHMRRFIAGDDSAVAHFWTDVRAALPGGTVVGVVSALVTAVLLLDVDLARSGFLPGGVVVEVVGWVGLAAVSLTLLTVTGLWTPQLGWRRAVRAVPRAIAADVAGAAYLVATAVFVVVVTWALPPLLLPALGLAALAAVAIPERRRRTR
ncbi:hypothetical protein QL996_02695 [Planococcus sp. APC 4015]|nr:hypothetical protein [Planococcus sp. APC 4015]